MSKLMHTPYRIGNIVISNRIVKSAMFEYCANQGKITDQHRQIYEDAARGGCGLIITGMEAISSTAGNGPGMIHTEYDGYLEDMRSIVSKVHRYTIKRPVGAAAVFLYSFSMPARAQTGRVATTVLPHHLLKWLMALFIMRLPKTN